MAGGSPPPGSTPSSAIWDADTGEQRFTMTGHTAAVVGLDWSPDSTRLASGSNDGTAKVSEIADGGVRELLSFSAQDTSGGLGGVAFSPDGERLMTGDAAITAVKIWDASANGGGELANVRARSSSGCRTPRWTSRLTAAVSWWATPMARCRSRTSSREIGWTRSNRERPPMGTSAGST